MNKGTWIAVGIAVLLGGIYLVTSESPQSTDEAPYTIQKVQGLSRIEVRPPASGGGSGGDAGASSGAGASDRPSLIAFEKREEGWWLTQPVEAPVSKTTAERFNDVFGGAIDTDDLQIPSDNPGAYKLDEGRAVKLSLYGDDGSSPSVEVMIGEEMKVEQTDAKRTFIQPVGEESIYRAQAALGDLVRKGVDDYRSDQIVSVDRKSVSKLVVDRADGMRIELVRETPEGGGDKESLPSLRGAWTLKEPSVDWELDQQAIKATVGVLTDLRATDFADDLSTSEAGLDEPDARLTVTAGDTTHELMIGVVDSRSDADDAEGDGKTVGDADPTYYAKRPGERFIYELETYAGNKLDTTLGKIRSKTPRTIPPSEVTRLTFPGQDGVVVGRDGGDWSLVRPSADKDFNGKKFDRYRQAALELTVESFPDVEPGEVGLERGSEELTIERKKQPTLRLLIGERAEEGGRYVRFSDEEEVYRISSSTYGTLTVAVEDVTGEMKKKGRGAMPKGMGGPPGGGGKLNPAQKRQLMQQLKQKMGNR